jgi:glycosyltransferase involved in cell wall biosynthesis
MSAARAKRPETAVVLAAEDGHGHLATGHGTFVRLLLPYLRRRFARVILAVAPEPTARSAGPAPRLAGVDRIIRLRPVEAGGAGLSLSPASAAEARALASAIDRHGPAILVGNEWRAAMLGRAVQRSMRAPARLVYVPHMFWLLAVLYGYEGPAALDLVRRLAPADAAVVRREIALLRAADHVLFISDSMRRYARDVLGVEPRRASVVPHHVEPPRAPKTRCRRVLRDVAFVGRLAPQKGIADLLEHFDEAMAILPRATFHFHGEGALRPFVEWLTRKHGRRAVIHGHTPRARLLAALPGYDLALVPSIYEPLGYTALEAAAAGVPLVASDVGGLAEIAALLPRPLRLRVQAGTHPCYASPDGIGNVIAPGEILRALRWAAGHPEALAQAAARCRREVLDRYGRARWSAEMDQAIADILG